ncbi:amidohydrolase [Burkholderia humptydooensis]|uniref:Amidohydrolase n=1 Tax=Burkholderia humptydooensis TaxID=430531 RepID=A0A7U4P537_9BURK|nr:MULTISPECIES: amidohydrolase family protein [Burkholderia]AJY42981.1 amidohydrolase family protein [Burkholderia sp. 2002721687]ALX43144.1 amidohydrolase [Burkholderia humptydooensis]QPS44940.1 amidohydrolase [Burkholderia humptydooensis]
MPKKIDTHHHIVPPSFAAWLESRGITAGGLPIPHWSEEGALELMEAEGTATGIFSVSTPGVHLGDDIEAREKAREVNEFTAGVVSRHPGRFGFFATLTLPDVEGAIAEATYAMDTLRADGVVLISSVRGTYLGDESWAPLFDELNRRQAVVFIHPGDLPCDPVAGIPPYVADFLLDTTRAAINIAKAGWLERFPDVKFVLSHAGGFVPYAAQRIARVVSPDNSNEGGLARLRRFYFDTALSSSPYALPALLAFADPSRITFGSDWPYANKDRSVDFTRMLEAFPLTDAQRQAIYRGNAERLFPRLAAG